MPASPFPVAQSYRRLTLLAWMVVVGASALPNILMMELIGHVPGWIGFAKITLLLILAMLAAFSKPWRPLRNLFLILLAVLVLSELLVRMDFSLPFLQAAFGNSVFDERMQAEQTGKLAITLVMIGFLLLLGYRRRDIFLTLGDLKTPMKPVPLLGFPKADPWYNFALQWGTYIALAIGVFMYLGVRPDQETFLKVVPILPSILFYAALNAFNEEFLYRAPMLATLEPVGGSAQSLWMSAYFFGIAHYFGAPGGLIGGVVSIFMGWILGKAMLETRGGFWAWWIHFLSDVAIFSFLAAALIAS